MENQTEEEVRVTQISDIALSHYSPILFELDMTRQYRQSIRPGGYAKPRGLWLSADGELDWPEWCEGEGFNLEALAYRTRWRIKEDSQVLHIQDMDEIFEFTDRFMASDDVPVGIDWGRVTQVYDGILITPYLWDARYRPKTMWYYGWDCASGCIWNLDVLERVA